MSHDAALDAIKMLREMGATQVSVGDVHVTFPPLETLDDFEDFEGLHEPKPKTVQEADEYLERLTYGSAEGGF